MTEGETYYDAWIPHLVSRDEQHARRYANQLVISSGAQRWPNVQVWKLELGKAGATPIVIGYPLERP